MENIKNQEEGLEKPKTKKERSPAQIESFKLEGVQRLYKAYELQRVLNVEEPEEIFIPQNQTKNNNRRRLLKRIDVQATNILEGRRVITNKQYNNYITGEQIENLE